MPKNIISLVDFAIRSAEGTIDISASISKIEGLYLDIACDEERVNKGIGKAVHGLYSKYPGRAFTMNDLPCHIIMEMGVAPDCNMTDLQEAILVYVRNSPEFYSKKGKGGGVRRITDMTADEVKDMNEKKACGRPSSCMNISSK